MNPVRQALLRELEDFGRNNDARATERRAKMLNITPDTGAFLAILVRLMRAPRILEVGTSNGYSTIWLADAAEAVGGRVTTVEVQPAKADLARQNFARAGLAALIDLHLSDGGDFLRQQASESFDLIFLDSYRPEYAGWWPDVRRLLAPGGLLVVDNAVSHPAEVAALVESVMATDGFHTVLVPVGKGEFLAFKENREPI